MAKNQSQRLRPAQVADDKARAANLQATEGYKPANEAYTAGKVAAACQVSTAHALIGPGKRRPPHHFG